MIPVDLYEEKFEAIGRPSKAGVVTTEAILKRLKMGLYVSDEDFDRIFPSKYRPMSRTHWTPVRAAITAA
ncbi:MAG: hypothetical protein ACXWQO_16670, partial [Bdellovibrionota bacterium]